eukprot:2923353-Rhodomonas_salina.2
MSDSEGPARLGRELLWDHQVQCSCCQCQGLVTCPRAPGWNCLQVTVTVTQTLAEQTQAAAVATAAWVAFKFRHHHDDHYLRV